MPTTFTQLSETLLLGEAPFPIWGANLGNRMTCLKLSNGEVVVISPNRFDEQIAETLKKLGRVKYFIAPNLHHNLFFGKYKQTFPAAVFYASPALFKTSKDFQFDKPLAESGMPWDGDLAAIHMQGAPGVDEFVFFHKSTQSLILTDLGMHFPTARNAWEAGWYRLVGAYKRFHVTLFVRMMIKDKVLFRQSLERVLEWPFETIVVTHGEIVQQGAATREIFRKGYPHLR